MSESAILSLKISLVVWLLFFLSIHLITSEKLRYYSGLTFIGRKFKPTKKDILPTGAIWLIGIYFAAYAFTAQRYESQLDKVESKYNIFTSQVAAGAKFSDERLMKILTTNIPIKPYIFKFFSILQSFADPYFSEQFFHSYDYSSASEFRAEIINQWKNKLEGADFSTANIESADFGCANLKKANFRDAILVKADFSRSNLKSTDFNSTNLINANFRNARLNWANFNDAKLAGADFRDANLEGAHFTATKDINKTDFFVKSRFN